MSFPEQFGLPQILLIIIAVVALALLVTSLVELRRVVDEDLPGRRRKLRMRPRIRAGRGMSGVALLLAAVFLLWIVALVQTYLGLTGEVKAAHVVATPISNAPHSLSVDLTLYDDKGRTKSHETYQVEGDTWLLQADIVELNHWVNVIGVHSGYKVTRLFGERTDGVSPTQHQILLNGGDGSFFTQMKNGTWWTKPFVRSAYGNAVIASPGEFDVFISQDAIKTRPGHA